MRAIANLAVSADYRPNILQAKALPLAVSMLRNAQLQGKSGSHTFAVLCHAARAIGNLCAGGEIAAAMQQKAGGGGVDRRAPPLAKSRARAPRGHAEGGGGPPAVAGGAQFWRNIGASVRNSAQRRSTPHRLSQSMDELLRETARAGEAVGAAAEPKAARRVGAGAGPPLPPPPPPPPPPATSSTSSTSSASTSLTPAPLRICSFTSSSN